MSTDMRHLTVPCFVCVCVCVCVCVDIAAYECLLCACVVQKHPFPSFSSLHRQRTIVTLTLSRARKHRTKSGI
jgi:hypothetical protein